jgi:hypothetical protein
MENMVIGPGDFHHRGVPSMVTLNVANGQLGPFQIELISQDDDRPSAYRDVYKQGEEGMHHMGMRTIEFDETVARYKTRGYEIAHVGKTMGMRFCYFDARRDFDCMIEIVESTEGGRKHAAMLLEVTAGWDGSNPYRAYTFPAQGART